MTATTVEGAKGIGVAALRKEERKFLSGRGRYVDDVKLPGMLHMAVVRSQYPHADITAIDTAAARSMPGVTAVLTGDDLEFAAGVPCASNPTGRPLLTIRSTSVCGTPSASIMCLVDEDFAHAQANACPRTGRARKSFS